MLLTMDAKGRGGRRAGAGRKPQNLERLNTRVAKSTKEVILRLKERMGCSEGKAVDYIAARFSLSEEVTSR